MFQQCDEDRIKAIKISHYNALIIVDYFQLQSKVLQLLWYDNVKAEMKCLSVKSAWLFHQIVKKNGNHDKKRVTLTQQN